MMTPIVVRGAGDLSTGVIHRLCMAGFPVIALESAKPTAIRREVSYCEAIYEGKKAVEGLVGTMANSPEEALAILTTQEGETMHPVLLVDEDCSSLEIIKPDILVDAIIAKKNLGTKKDMAKLTVALGPGFIAGDDVDYVIETKRGHDLGRIISNGKATENTGIPGIIAGVGKERVIHAPASGTLKTIASIGDMVKEGDSIAQIETGEEVVPVLASIDGVLRGLLRDGFEVQEGLKMADIDPRAEEYKNCFTISDKARCISGSVLEVIVRYLRESEKDKNK